MAKKKVARAKAKKSRAKKAKRAVSKKSGAKRAKKAFSKKKKGKKAVSKKKKAKKAVSKTKKPKKSVKKAIGKKAKPVRFVLEKANMLITYDPNHKGTAEAEVKDAFGRIGMDIEVMDSGIEGLFKAATPRPKEAAKALVALCKSDPSVFSVTHRYIPIEKWCRSEIPEMQATIKSVVGGIGVEEKWKMGLNKRRWDQLHGTELIIKLTDVIDRPNVDLTNPDKVVQVEIVGMETGVSLLKPTELLDVPKIKSG